MELKMRWLVVLLCLACWVPGFVLGERSQQHYYSMVQDILDGIDYYQVFFSFSFSFFFLFFLYFYLTIIINKQQKGFRSRKDCRVEGNSKSISNSFSSTPS